VKQNHFAIRPVTETDLPSLWLVAKPYADAEEAFTARVRRKQLLADHYIPVCLINDQVVGYAWVHEYGEHIRNGRSTARLNDLIVAPEWRHQGVGRALFESVVAWAEGRGVKWLQWQASTKAVSFYERLGLKGRPCPDPEHPFFEITFPR
jgi:GNAT superfamily N-acetyltransferase